MNSLAPIKNEFRSFFPFCKKARSSLYPTWKVVGTKTHLAVRNRLIFKRSEKQYLRLLKNWLLLGLQKIASKKGKEMCVELFYAGWLQTYILFTQVLVLFYAAFGRTAMIILLRYLGSIFAIYYLNLWLNYTDLEKASGWFIQVHR